MKNFDQWNDLKKVVNDRTGKFYINPREIRYAHLGVNIGFEEDGKGDDFKRPVLVLKKV